MPSYQPVSLHIQYLPHTTMRLDTGAHGWEAIPRTTRIGPHRTQYHIAALRIIRLCGVVLTVCVYALQSRRDVAGRQGGSFLRAPPALWRALTRGALWPGLSSSGSAPGCLWCGSDELPDDGGVVGSGGLVVAVVVARHSLRHSWVTVPMHRHYVRTLKYYPPVIYHGQGWLDSAWAQTNIRCPKRRFDAT